MTTKPTVFIIGGGYQYKELFRVHNWEVVDNMADADLFQFTGGEDVSPILYGHGKHPMTWNNPARDAREKLVFDHGVHDKKAMAGICRGGQFLNVMCGGKMWQDVNNHGLAGTHEIKELETGELWQGTSTHHQMMIPGRGARVVGVAALSTRRERCDINGKIRVSHLIKPERTDIEVVYYQDYRALCFQPHPEFDGYREGKLGNKYMEYLHKYLDLAA